MSDSIEIPTLQQSVLHEISKKIWNFLALQQEKEICESLNHLYSSNYFDNYRHKMSKALPRVLPPKFPILLKDKLVDAMMNLRLGCGEAYDWLLFYRGIIELSEDTQNLKLKCGNILFSEKGHYEAIHFIDPSGHFDDLSWAKLFVADERQPLKCRFYLACLFEEEIYTLWNIAKANNQCFCENDFGVHNGLNRPLIRLWISRLERGIKNSFYVHGFDLSFFRLHEYAAKFFWKHCSLDERTGILSKILHDFRFLCLAETGNRVGFVYFVYSLLSLELKISLFSLTLWHLTALLVFLLRSYCYKSILNDIQSLPYPFPADFYTLLLDFSRLINRSSFVQHKVVFITLWNLLSQNERIEVMHSIPMLAALCCSHSLDLCEMIILPLPRSVKDNELLNSSSHLFIKVWDRFRNKGDYDGFLRCLLFFFLEYEGATKKLTLRSDAANLYDRLMHSEHIEEISKYLSSTRKFNVIMEHFKETLSDVNELVKQVDYATITHDFLSSRIYPLLHVKD